jgi:hypothetical protein|tara:strand:- start:3403 stop:3639 length:237 start_codon:yes stop_codon:yes gene_type:complete
MLLYESKHEEGSLDIVTRAYINEEQENDYRLTLYQYLFKGDEVVSSNEVMLFPEQVNKIANIYLGVEAKMIIDKYKLE